MSAAQTMCMFTAPEHRPRGCEHCGGSLSARTASEWDNAKYCSHACSEQSRRALPDPENELLLYPLVPLHGDADWLLDPGDPLSHADIATLLGMPEKRVVEIERDVMVRLKEMCREE